MTGRASSSEGSAERVIWGHLSKPQCGGGRRALATLAARSFLRTSTLRGPTPPGVVRVGFLQSVGSRRESQQGLQGASFGSQLSGCESGSVRSRVGAAGCTGDRVSGRRTAGSFFGRDRLSERRVTPRGATLQQEGRTGQRPWKKGDRRQTVQLGPDRTLSGALRDRSLPTSSDPGRWRQSSGWLPQTRSGFTRRGG